MGEDKRKRGGASSEEGKPAEATGSVYLVSLGCPKNRVDSEMMLGGLTRFGLTVISEPAAADILVVNTCAFIEPAKEESIETILALAAIKARDERKRLIVTGCLAQRYGAELSVEMPEVDHFIGTGDIREIERVAAHEARKEPPPRVMVSTGEQPYWEGAPRLRSTRGGSAYLKISEGCDNICSFCVIPQIRGPQRSRSVDSLVEEAEALVAGGARELNLIAQDLTAYGRDLPSRPHLADLLEPLSSIGDLEWIRMLYGYPRPMPERFFDLWSESEKILPYLDIPLQHASSRLLGKMKRGSNMELVRRELGRMRERVGGLTLRTTFLVGHPQETDEDFEELLRFVGEMRFERAGVFTYSDEEGTAAFDMDDKIPESLAEERRARLMEAQREISAEHQASLVGRRLNVLVEGASEESELVLQGRHEGQAPEIDGVVYLEGGTARPGEMVEVRITSAYDYDLVGTIVSRRGSKDPSPLKVVP